MVMRNLMEEYLFTTLTAMTVWRILGGTGIIGGQMTGSLMNPSTLLPARGPSVLGLTLLKCNKSKLFDGVSILMLISTIW